MEKMGKYAKARFENAKAQKDQRESNACFMVFRNLNTEASKAYCFTLTTIVWMCIGAGTPVFA